MYERHANIGQMTRDGVRNLGLELLVQDETYASNTVTAIKMPENIDGAKFVNMVRTEKNVVLAGGQGKLSGKVFRIGHLGHVSEADIEEVLEALRVVLAKVGFSAR